jgi:hypothetical protein
MKLYENAKKYPDKWMALKVTFLAELWGIVDGERVAVLDKKAATVESFASHIQKHLAESKRLAALSQRESQKGMRFLLQLAMSAKEMRELTGIEEAACDVMCVGVAADKDGCCG